MLLMQRDLIPILEEECEKVDCNTCLLITLLDIVFCGDACILMVLYHCKLCFTARLYKCTFNMKFQTMKP